MGLGAILGGVGGGVKSLVNNKRNKEDAKARKMTIMLSPWTGMSDPGAPQRQTGIGSIAGGIGAGAQLQQGLTKSPAEELKELQAKKELEAFKRAENPLNVPMPDMGRPRSAWGGM